MAEFVWGGYRLEVDVEATRAYYDSHPGPWITCTCDGCRNFMLAVKMLPQAVRDFFHTLGLDPEKPGELCYYQGTAQRLSGGGCTIWRGGFCPVIQSRGQRSCFRRGGMSWTNTARWHSSRTAICWRRIFPVPVSRWSSTMICPGC